VVEKLDSVQAAIGQSFQKVAADTEDRISSTVTIQEVVAGAAVSIGLLIAFFIARGIIGPLSGLTSGRLPWLTEYSPSARSTFVPNSDLPARSRISEGNDRPRRLGPYTLSLVIFPLIINRVRFPSDTSVLRYVSFGVERRFLFRRRGAWQRA
jgi:hypothetical protein